MASKSAQWADDPFTLIPVPGEGQDLGQLHEAVYLANEMACAHVWPFPHTKFYCFLLCEL